MKDQEIKFVRMDSRRIEVQVSGKNGLIIQEDGETKISPNLSKYSEQILKKLTESGV